MRVSTSDNIQSASEGHISYEEKNGNLYARHTKCSKRINGKLHHTNVYLGKVIDKEKGVFQSRERGIFIFNTKEGFKEVSLSIIPKDSIKINHKDLDFGDIWLIDQKFKQLGLDTILDSLIPGCGDTLKSLVGFRLIENKAYNCADVWYNDSYAQILYPNATLDSSQISIFQNKLGTKEIHIAFFDKYLTHITKDENLKDKISLPVLIDSTKIINNIKSHYTQISKQRGHVDNILRLIYVVDRRTNLPIFFRLVSGNIIDQSTLKTTINSLLAYKIELDMIIIDAGYSALDNLAGLSEVGIPFITRMSRRLTEYKKLVDTYQAELDNPLYLFNSSSNVYYGIKTPVNLAGNTFIAYIVKDVKKRSEEISKIYFKISGNLEKQDKLIEDTKSAGIFVLLSSLDMDISEMMELYKSRDAIEKIFDYVKNQTDLIPLNAHSDNTIRARILISFLSAIVCSSISNDLRSSNYCVPYSLFILSHLSITMYPDSIMILHELTKQQKDLFSILKLPNPFHEEKGCQLNNNLTFEKIINRPYRKPGRPKGSKNKKKQDKHLTLTANSETLSKRKPGRPKSTKNKRKTVLQSNNTIESNVITKKQIGRPKGSKNKEKPRPWRQSTESKLRNKNNAD
jgi:transposase